MSANEADRFPVQSRSHSAPAPRTRSCHQTTSPYSKNPVAAVRSAAGQLSLAERLAESPAGGEELLGLVERGQASGRLLLQPSVRLRLEALKQVGWGERIATLTENLPQLDEANAGRITATIAAFQAEPGDAGRGAALFTTHCGNCHRIGTAGAMVGPQLDGVGVRGLERLVEDVLDPNRNVDGAFRSSTLVMADGRVLTGLIRREEGETLILADQAGKEFSVPTAEIEERVNSAISLMPSNWSEVLTGAQLRDLLAYLLAQRAAVGIGHPRRTDRVGRAVGIGVLELGSGGWVHCVRDVIE